MKCELKDICQYRDGKVLVNTLDNKNYVSTENMLPDKRGIQPATSLPNTAVTQRYCVGDVLVSNIRPYFKKIYFAKNDGGCSNDVLVFQSLNDVEPQYLYYVLANDEFFAYCTASSKGTKMPRGDKGAIMQYKVNLPDLETQKKIAKVLSALDDKIELNNQINKNLEEQAQALYQQMFETVPYSSRRICKADECFDISIGKTPPRKEPEWFSFNPKDVNWVSISDMGNCGLYISSSSERLTLDAVKQHNIKMVPDNTVLLSFKLTVGRVAITNGEMTTNEAIAHFKTENKDIVEYLYFYLKGFNFQTMGSTSSIAVAVNSKMIKAMPFVMPDTEKLLQFHSVVGPMFAEIKANQVASNKLKELRDSLLPKLMSGEIDVDNVEI